MDLIPPGTSSEGSDETPRRGSRIRAEEEEQGGVTPISRSSAATGPDHEGSSLSPASGADGFSSVATDPNDDSRPITKKELTRFRRVVVKTFQTMNNDLMSLIKAEIEDQNREREALKDLLASRISTLNSLMDNHVEEVLKQSALPAIDAAIGTRIEPLTEAAMASIEALRSDIASVTDALGDKVAVLEDTVLAVSTMAEENNAMAKAAIVKVTQDVEDHMSDPWSDWDIVETEGFHALSRRVEELEAGTAS